MKLLFTLTVLCLGAALAQEKVNECALCHTFVQLAAGEIDKPLADIKKDMYKLCDDLGASEAAQCHAVVNQFAQQIYQWLKDGQTADQICTKVGLCTKIVKQQNVDKCGACVALLHVADGMLDQPLPNIEAKMKQLCAQFASGSDIKKCQEDVDKYGQQIYDALKAGQTPKQLCAAVGICTNNLALPRLDKCKGCKFAVRALGGVLHLEEGNLEKEVAKICAKLGSFANVCTSFLDKELDTIVADLQNGDDETKICKKFKLCM
jgi:hypothetical protein